MQPFLDEIAAETSTICAFSGNYESGEIYDARTDEDHDRKWSFINVSFTPKNKGRTIKVSPPSDKVLVDPFTAVASTTAANTTTETATSPKKVFIVDTVDTSVSAVPQLHWLP